MSLPFFFARFSRAHLKNLVLFPRLAVWHMLCPRIDEMWCIFASISELVGEGTTAGGVLPAWETAQGF